MEYASHMPVRDFMSYLLGRTKADFREIGLKCTNSRKVYEKRKMTLV